MTEGTRHTIAFVLVAFTLAVLALHLTVGRSGETGRRIARDLTFGGGVVVVLVIIYALITQRAGGPTP